jgi:hypothetical protein
MLVERGVNRVTLFNVAKYDFTAAYPDTLVLLTDRDAGVNNIDGRKRTYPLTALIATCLSVYLVDEKGCDCEAYDWLWTKTGIPLLSRIRRILRHYRRISQFNLLCDRRVTRRVTWICFVRTYAVQLKYSGFLLWKPT